MIPCEAGEVVLVRFPFTDLASAKKRPALVVSPPAFATRHGDIVVLAMTSRDPQDDTLRLQEWRQAGLPKPTWIKPLIGTLAGGLVQRRLGKLSDDDRSRAVTAIRLLIDSALLP